ncbi:MAG: 1-(5-phosphoribosyl)-5-[(5-phosphoribosylamino)methylideneamino]imidazole-4-carboxamide isomerase [Dethiobacteria bacterium]
MIPAIDLHGGKCVRLLQGKREKETVYSLNPVEVALKWQSEGARRLHIVDLDGAFAGRPVNSSIIAEIVSNLDIPLQLGGGIREIQTVKNALELGVSRVILGTAAVEKPELVKEMVALYGEKIQVGIDARDGFVAVKGWVEASPKKALDFALEMQGYGVREIIYTDISRDGTLAGPNLKALKEMAEVLEIPVIASGGVSSLEDLRLLKDLEPFGVESVIIGQALYTGRFSLRDAIMELEK